MYEQDLVNSLLNKENVTLLIAIWGSVLATYKVVSDYRQSKREIKVELSYGFRWVRQKVGLKTISITAINMRHRPVTLTAMGFILPDKRFLTPLSPQTNIQFPYELTEGRSCDLWLECEDLAQNLKEEGFSKKVKLRGYCRSVIGKIYKSKPIKFDLN